MSLSQRLPSLVAPARHCLLLSGGLRCCIVSSNSRTLSAPQLPETGRTFATSPNRPDRQPLSTETAIVEPTISRAHPFRPPTTKANPERRRRRGYVYAAIFLLLGTSAGSLLRLSLAPPPFPEPGTKEDKYIVASIHEKAEKLPLVQSLSADPAWESWHAYQDREKGPRPPSITSGPLQGCRGLAYQRIFHNKDTGEMISVIYLGGALSGFPGVVHGGVLATVLDEGLGRCAIYRFPARTGVTANLDVAYKNPTLTNAFYVMKTKPVLVDSDEIVAKDGTKKSDRKLWVTGSIETLEGKVCVESKALFVVPKNAKVGRLDDKW